MLPDHFLKEKKKKVWERKKPTNTFTHDRGVIPSHWEGPSTDENPRMGNDVCKVLWLGCYHLYCIHSRWLRIHPKLRNKLTNQTAPHTRQRGAHRPVSHGPNNGIPVGARYSADGCIHCVLCRATSHALCNLLNQPSRIRCR